MIDPAILTSSLLGLLQGLTEFLPVSSSGHLVLAHEVFGGAGAQDLAFDALLHFATATAIVAYFWRDIYALLQASLRLPGACMEKRQLDTEETSVVALVAGTVPAVILGLLLEGALATVFRNPLLVALALVFGSCIMVAAERVRRAHEARAALHTHIGSWKNGLVVGLFQSLALIPGMSRSGMSIAGAMMLGITRHEAARFSFLLGAPLLLGAGAKKALDLAASGTFSDVGTSVIAGVIVAFVSALVVIHVLLRFLRHHSLYWFVGYRLALAALVLVVVVLY